MFCMNCGAEIPNGSLSCVKCGEKLKDYQLGSASVAEPEANLRQRLTYELQTEKAEEKKKHRTFVVVFIIVALLLAAALTALVLKFVIDKGKKDTKEENVKVDVFYGVVLTLSGEEPNGKATLDYSASSYKDKLRFTVDKTEGLSNGDVITVTAGCGDGNETSDAAFTEAIGAIPEQKSITVTVSGLAEAPEASAEVPENTPAPEASPEPESEPEPEYLLPESNTRHITGAELDELTWEQCCLARNEIYARHGYIFKTAQIQKYFESKAWYHGTVNADSFDYSTLNAFEADNVDLIQQYEESKYGKSFY